MPGWLLLMITRPCWAFVWTKLAKAKFTCSGYKRCLLVQRPAPITLSFARASALPPSLILFARHFPHYSNLYYFLCSSFPFQPMNTRCSSDSGCDENHCCAMKLGTAVCRRRPLIGQNCQDWTPLDTNALFSFCPCAQGLECRRIPRRDVGVCYMARR